MLIRNRPEIYQNIPRIKEIINDPNVEVFFVATPYLKELIIKDDIHIVDMPKFFKKTLLNGNGLLMDKNTVIKYLEGTLDKRNMFVFDNSDIRVMRINENTSSTGVVKENLNISDIILKS